MVMKDREERIKRIERVMMGFKPTPDITRSIIDMNDGLYNRFRLVFDDLMNMKKLIDEDIESGRLKVSGYTMFPEYFFAYDRMDGIPTADHEMLMFLSDETQYPSLTLDEKRLEQSLDYETSFLENDLFENWNIEWFELPGLENRKIHYFMHRIFQDADTFCPADIPYLRPEDLQWQIVVQYEFFNK